MRRLAIDPSLPLPANGIVKASLMAWFLAAERIEIAARKRADEEMRSAREAIEAERRAARRAGHANGLDAFAAAIRQLDQVRKQLDGRIEMLLRECLQQILGGMPREDLLAATLATVLRDLRQPLEVMVMAHPNAIPALDRALAAYRGSRSNTLFIRGQPNAAMKPEECLIYAGSDVVDASIPVMIDELLSALTLSTPQEAAHVA